MNVLVIGGSGYVAGLVLPYLRREHDLRLFDLLPPQSPELQDLPFIAGNACEPAMLAPACRGMDMLLYMAMGAQHWHSNEAISTAFDSSVKGVYFALKTAHEAGMAHAVYTSSMSVYEGDLYKRYFPDEDITPDGRHFYGLTKYFGEQVCRNACREYGMTLNALRLCHPRAEDRWQAELTPGQSTIATTAEDVARALLAALAYRGGGFEAFMISGDYEQKLMNMSKAKRLLGWEPQGRPAK